MNKIIFTERQIQDIISLYQSGLNARQIAKKFKISFTPINNLLNKLKIPRKSGHQRICDDLEQQIIKLYTQENLSSLVISQKLNVSKQCVLRTLKRNSILRRSNIRKPTPKISKNILEKLYIYDNDTLNKISTELNVATNTIKRWLVFYNIPLRKEKLSRFLIKTLIAKSVRAKLDKWKKEIKARDENRCQRCLCNLNLEVHHIEKLSDIVKKYLNKYQYLDINKNENFNFITNSIANAHSLEMGITLCDKCHCEVDNARKQIGLRFK